jgi:Flp pilus assembly pilin Flp
MKQRVCATYRKLRTYLAKDEDGAVTIDWVVITAIIAGLGMATAYTLSTTLAHPSNNLVQYLSSREIKTTF